MTVTIDTHDRTGPVLAEAPPAHPAAATEVYDGMLVQADRLAQAIVQANLGAPSGARNPSRIAKQ